MQQKNWEKFPKLGKRKKKIRFKKHGKPQQVKYKEKHTQAQTAQKAHTVEPLKVQITVE